MKALIIKSISGEYDCLIDDTNEVITCKQSGNFKNKKIEPKVGDIANVEGNSIISIEMRKNDLIRPLVANVDKAFIVTSLVEPDLNLNLLDRLICNIEYNSITPILVFTKVDLVKNISDYNKIFEYYKNIGYRIYLLPNDKDKIKQEIDNNISVLVGQSGVGKSTMMNTISDLKIKTGEISKALGRGKHTTRHTELLKIGNGYIADTPGFGSLELDMDEVSVSQNFTEFFKVRCKYNGCLHINEPGCKVKEKVENGEILKSRYDNYLSFIKEIKDSKEKGYTTREFQTKGYHSSNKK